LKIKKKKITEIVKKVIKEAAAEGKFQNYARGTFASMIKLASSGSINNTPPFTQKAPRPGKSAPPGSAE
jgi:hypothetical protein